MSTKRGIWTLLLFYMTVLCLREASTPAGRPVNGIVGESFRFPAPVPLSGSIRYKLLDTIAVIFNGQSKTDLEEKFKNRLHWDNESGLFILSDLKMEDFGLYTVENIDGEKKSYLFQLTVYNNITEPQLILHDDSSCSWLCSVENGREVTLSWYTGNEILNQTSSSDLSTSLSLLLKPEHNLTYSCVAANPVSNWTTQLNIKERCKKNTEDLGRRQRTILAPVLCAVAGVVLVIGVAVFLKRNKHPDTEGPSAAEDIFYSEIIHKKQSDTQGDISELALSEGSQTLTTVYDQIRPHRIKDSDPDLC